MVTMTWCGMTPAGASVVRQWQRPVPSEVLDRAHRERRRTDRDQARPEEGDALNHREASGLRSWTSAQKARIPPTAASGSAASNTTLGWRKRDDPGEHHRDRGRGVPAPRRTIQHHEDHQQGNLGADMVRHQELEVNAVAELRGEQDP